MMPQRSLRDYGLGRTHDPALDAKRLGRVDDANLRILLDGQWHRSTELRGLAAHSSVARLRKAGYAVESRRDPAHPGSGVWQYRMTQVPPEGHLP